jgi:hypothetical protein
VATYKEYLEQIRAVLDRLRQIENVRSLPEAKSFLKVIRDAQRDLRKIKRDINQEMKGVRAEYKRASAQVTKSTTALTLFTKGSWNKAVRASTTMQRQKLMANRDKILEAYDELKYLIDQEIAELDGLKDSTQLAITEEKERERAKKAKEKAEVQAAKKSVVQRQQRVLRRLSSQQQTRADIANLDQALLSEEQFRQILRIVLADGIITKEEMIEAEKVRKQLNISSARAKEILKEMLPK